MHHWFVAHNYFQLDSPCGGLVVYGVGLLWAIWTRKAWQVKGAVMIRMPPTRLRSG
jgi:hypothetical protein